MDKLIIYPSRFALFEVLRDRMRSLDLDYTKLAVKSGVNRSNLCRIMNGSRDCCIDTLCKILIALDCNIQIDLLTDNDVFRQHFQYVRLMNEKLKKLGYPHVVPAN